MEDLDRYASLFRLLSAIWAVVGLFIAGGVLWWLFKYFPLRREAITPEQLNQSLKDLNKSLCDKIEKTDFASREATNAAIGRAQTSFEYQITTMKETLQGLRESMIAAHRKAQEAHEEAQRAMHQAELNKKDVDNLETRVMERLDHLTTILKTIQK